MGDCMRNCKRAAVMELESSSTALAKRLKMDFDFEEVKYSPSFNRLLAISSVGEAVPPAKLSNSGVFLTGDGCSVDSPPSFCSSSESSEVKSFETESSTCINNKFSRETTPSSEVCGDTDGMEKQTVRARTCQRRLTTVKMPSQEEIEEFFAAAEKREEKQFEEKYNYDIAKDAPLEGRYQWVRLKP